MTEPKHFVITYTRDEELLEAAVPRLKEAYEHGAAIVIIATAEHGKLFRQALGSGERVIVMDATEVLGRFCSPQSLEAGDFDRVIGELVRDRMDSAPVAAFGEMVDLLWKQGRKEAALKLEALWERLGAGKTFDLTCSYRLDSLAAQSYEGPLEAIARCHGEALVTASDLRASAAIDHALAQVAGPISRLIQAMVDAETPAALTPGQRRLLWLRRNLPLTAEKIFKHLDEHLGVGG